VGNSSRLAGCCTWWGTILITRPARSTAISDLFALFLFHFSHWLLSEGVIFILTYLKDACRADLYTFATAIAFISVNCKEPVTRAIFETVIG